MQHHREPAEDRPGDPPGGIRQQPDGNENHQRLPERLAQDRVPSGEQPRGVGLQVAFVAIVLARPGVGAPLRKVMWVDVGALGAVLAAVLLLAERGKLRRHLVRNLDDVHAEAWIGETAAAVHLGDRDVAVRALRRRRTP